MGRALPHEVGLIDLSVHELSLHRVSHSDTTGKIEGIRLNLNCVSHDCNASCPESVVSLTPMCILYLFPFTSGVFITCVC